MGGQSQPTTTTQIQKTELPAWVDAASQQNYDFARQVADRPFQQYEGQRVAGLSAGEQAAPNTLQAGMDTASQLYGNAGGALSYFASGQFNPGTIQAPGGMLAVNAPGTASAVPQFGAAGNIVNRGGYMGVNSGGAAGDVAMSGGVGNVQGGQGYMGIGAQGPVANVGAFGGARDVTAPGNVSDVLAQRFSGSDLSGYMNPFTDNVVNTTLQGMDRNIATAQQQNTDANRASGAWGGSRDAITNAVLQSEGIRNKASTEAGLRSAAYTDAAGRLMTDNQSQLQAGLANQQKDITGNAQRITAQTANQNADLAGGQLNAQIGIANQSSANTAAGRQLSADQSNQSSFLQNAAQRLQADQGNQSAGLATNQLNANIGMANQTNQNNALNRDLSAQQGNQQSFLQANAQDIGVQSANQANTNTSNALNAGIMQGNQSAQTANNALNVQGQIANQGALQALQGMGLQAQTSNAANRLAGANLGVQAATGLAGLGDSVTNSAGKNALLQSQFGANDRSVQQAGLDAAQQKFLEQYNAPMDALNTRLAALGMSPYGKTTSSTETKSGGTSSNTGMQIAGGLMSFLPLMFSDERLKKNVRTEGTTEAGVPLKSYEYKGFMGRKMPGRQIGVMAQDLEKVRPDAVHRVRGEDGKSYRAVDYSKVGRGFMGGKKRAA